jgi:hypothetical protein
LGLADGGVHGVGVGDIQPDGMYLVAVLGDQVVELLGASSGCRDSAAVSEDSPDQSAPEPAGGAGDEPCFGHAFSKTWLC